MARAYACSGSMGAPTASRPGYVYEIEVSDDKVCKIMDPVIEIANSLPKPWATPQYQHDGSQLFLLGVIDPLNLLHFAQEHCITPPGSSGTPRAPNLTLELEALTRALRDAEILIYGPVPASVTRNRYEVF